jgi:hypothetical protein
MDISHHRLFKPVGIKKDEIKRSFPKLSFVNKGHDAINLDNILHHKSVKS